MLKEKIFYKEGMPVNALVANIREYPIHFHNDIEVAYVLAGSVILKNGYYTYTLNQGDVFILNDKEIHSYYSAGADNMVMLLQMDIAYFANYYDDFRNCFFITNVNDENDESPEVLRNLLARIMMEILQKGRNFEDKVIEHTHNLISCLISDFQNFAMEDGKFVNETKQKSNRIVVERMRRITDYMYENHTRKLTLGEIANREHLSVFYLSHVIREVTGLSFQDLLSFIRVEESEKLLLGTDKKTGVIAEESGFSATRYYVKHFLKWFKMSPNEYRKKYTGKVSSRKIIADYERCNSSDIEKAIKKQVKTIGSEYVGAGKPERTILRIDIEECMSDKHQKFRFPDAMFEKEIMKVAARPFNLFKGLNERILLSDRNCLVSTAGTHSDIRNLSILAYNYSDGFRENVMGHIKKESFFEQLKAYEDEAEIIVRCMGLSGNFRVVKYKMTKQNVISACEEWTRAGGTLNKRQAIINSWSTLPNIETEEITISDTINIRIVLSGLSAELILIDRK